MLESARCLHKPVLAGIIDRVSVWDPALGEIWHLIYEHPNEFWNNRFAVPGFGKVIQVIRG
ncbi:MAG: hypothetical protein WCE61_13310 [Candidatus Acidiferrum sp.]